MDGMRVPRRVRRFVVLILVVCVIMMFIGTRTKTPNSIIHLTDDDEDEEDDMSVDFDRRSLKYITSTSIIQNYNSFMIENPDVVDWGKFAYVFYATDPDRLIPILINVVELRRLGTQAKIEVVCSFDITAVGERTREMVSLLEDDDVVLNVVKGLKSDIDGDDTYWKESFTKLYVFNLTHYDRIVFMDADAIVRRLMDHLFMLPPALLAAPINYLDFKDVNGNDGVGQVAQGDAPPTPLEHVLGIHDLYKKLIEKEKVFDVEYFWKLYAELPSMEVSVDTFDKMKLGSYFMVIQPNAKVFEWLEYAIKSKKVGEYDMEIVNNVWKLSDVINKNEFVQKGRGKRDNNGFNEWLKSEKIPALLILPHNPYGLISGEFRHDLFHHAAYLSTPVDFPYLSRNGLSLSERRLVSGEDYDGIEDALGKFGDVGYWDWAWRFEEGKDNLGHEETVGGWVEPMKWKNEELKDMYQSEEVSFNVDIFGWDSKRIYKEAYYIHWSDWPLNKAWRLSSIENNNNPMFVKIGADSLSLCNQQVEAVFTQFAGKAGKELEFALEQCKESHDFWNLMYADYFKLLVEVEKKINAKTKTMKVDTQNK